MISPNIAPFFEAPEVPPRVAPPPPLSFLNFSQMAAMPEPEWLVEGVLQTRTAALLFGKSNAFKSFLGIDLACSVATGRSWHGAEVKQGRALFIATEGSNGVGRIRIPGWMQHHNIPVGDRGGVYLLPHEVALDTPKQVGELVRSINHAVYGQGFKLVVVDIFGGSMIGSEIKDEVARAWVHGVQRLIRECGVTVLTIAHTGWADDTRARMHTHSWGSFDTRLKAEGDKANLTTVLTVDRHKDADSSGEWGFKLHVVDAGGPYSTLVPILDGDVRNFGKASQHDLKPATRNGLQALNDTLLDHGVKPPTALGLPRSIHSVVTKTQWQERMYERGTIDRDAAGRRADYKRIKDDLLNRRMIAFHGEYLWPVPPDDRST